MYFRLCVLVSAFIVAAFSLSVGRAVAQFGAGIKPAIEESGNQEAEDTAKRRGADPFTAVAGPETGESHTADVICHCIGAGSSNSESVKKIEKALESPLRSGGLELSEQPLSDVVAMVAEEYQIPIQIERRALESAGISNEEPISVQLHNISLSAALRLALSSVGLTFDIQDEVLLITTPEETERRLRLCVYDVRGIVGSSESQLGAIVDMLQSCVAKSTWSANGGGEADIRAIKPGVLIISQTASVHREIRDVLSTLARMGSHGIAAQQPASAPGQGGEAMLVTRAYTLSLSPTGDIDMLRSQIRELITGALPDAVWTGRISDGQAVALTIFHDRVVVRNTPEVHEKLSQLLAESGIATPVMSEANTPHGFGGRMGFGGVGGFGGGGTGGDGFGGGGGFGRGGMEDGDRPGGGFFRP